MTYEHNNRLRDALRAFQARWNFLAVAVYLIEGDYGSRIAAEGAVCCECDRVHLAAGNIGVVARTGQARISRDVGSDPSYRSCFPGVKSEAVVPVKSNDKVIGIIDVEAGDGVCLNTAEIDAFAAHIAPLLLKNAK